ncbi:MAG: glycosyltransferase [Pseudomonadota bacterium]
MMMTRGATSRPLLSIITVVERLNSAEFEQTKASIAPVICDRGAIEWLIVPGDAPIEASHKSSATLTGQMINMTTLAPNKTGIYAAMNDGLRRACGDYVWFLNGGDCLTSRTAFEAMLRELEITRPDLLYADSREFRPDARDQYWLKPARHYRHWRLGMFTHHQAMVFRRDLLPSTAYAEHFDVAADYAFTLAQLQAAKQISRLPMALADVSLGGFSERQHDRGRQQQHLIRCQVGAVPSAASLMIKGLQRVSHQLRSKAPGAWRLLRQSKRA